MRDIFVIKISAELRENFAMADDRIGSSHALCWDFDGDVTLDLCLTAQAPGILRNTHVLLPVIAGTQVLHTSTDRTHTCRAETIPPTSVLHGNIMVEGNLEDGLACLVVDHLLLAIVEEGDLGHCTARNRGVLSIQG